MELILKNGKLLDIKNNFLYKKSDILIKDGRIERIAEIIEKPGVKEIDLRDKIISPGFIDVHVHCFPKNTVISAIPDSIGIKMGVTSIIDAGTAGADTMDEFYEEFILKSKTRIFSNLNISSLGLRTLSELSDLNNIEKAKIEKIIRRYKGVIVGLKARASGSVVKEQGIEPIKRAKQIARELKLPLVVHIGNAPPKVEEVLNLLEKGDVVTHCYNNKKTGLIREGNVIPEVFKAKKKGVLFDVGHGSESFSFDTAKIALEKDFEAELIGTDLYERNILKPVQSLETTINKMWNLGVPLERCIEKVTNIPAQVFKLNNLGELKKGSFADFTIFEIKNDKIQVEDSVGVKLEINKYIKIKFVYIKEELIEI